MREMTFGFAVALVWASSALGQSGETQNEILGPTVKTGLTREELIRSWDLDGDGTISKSEADIARARMRRQRAEMQLDTGLDPVTGTVRGTSSAPTTVETQPKYQLPPEEPTDGPEEPTEPDSTGKPKSTRPKPMAELLAPIATPTPVPGLPRMPNLAGKKDGPSSSPPVERSGRASWLPPMRAGGTTLGGPRAGAPPAVPGYGSNAWSDLNAGRFRAMQAEAERSATATSQSPTTGGGLLPTVRRPGQTGAIILPGHTNSRMAPQPPRAPPAPRVPLYSPPRISAEDIGGYRP